MAEDRAVTTGAKEIGVGIGDPVAGKAGTATAPFPASGEQQGLSPAGMRAQNERLVLSLVRRHGALSKAEIARMTGLSAQTVSVIMRQLEADALLLRGEPKRGRVGQPSVPHSLNPDGAFFLGAKVGRRSLDVVLIDFLGGIRHRLGTTYRFPDPDAAAAAIVAAAEDCATQLGSLRGRIAGVGLAMPFELWSWAEATGAPAAAVEAWRDADIRAALERRLPYPVYSQNDATAACGAELAFGTGAGLRDFLYFFVGSFIGGGVVLNGRLYVGRTGNAGALGSMPVPGPGGRWQQLIDQASLVTLERELAALDLPPDTLYREPADWSALGRPLDAWIATAARGFAHAIVAGAATIDFEAAVIDGAFPADVRARLIAATALEMAAMDTAGIQPPRLQAGSLGPIARALGGATLPLFDRFLVGQIALPTLA
jgi:predicted NBD/HSP70 family sugar kinase